MKGAIDRSDGRFGNGLAAAARSIIADGRQALKDPELSAPEAVHELRKALYCGCWPDPLANRPTKCMPRRAN